MSVHQPYRSNPPLPKPLPGRMPKKYQPGTVWIRKKDGQIFVLLKKDGIGLRFQGYDGTFCEEMFHPKNA